MRELKFRQYIESPTGRHVFFFWGYLTGDGVFTCPKTGHSEQYTGLLDSTGMEIYEGDLVKYQNPWYRQGKADDLHVLGTVEWCNSRGLWQVYDKYTTWDLGSEVSDACTIIGNIHENPELVSNRASD